jgi:hypothetical protein
MQAFVWRVRRATVAVSAGGPSCQSSPRWQGMRARSTVVPFGRSLYSGGVLLVRLRPCRQLNPGMSATVVDRIFRWRKAWVGEGAHGHAHRRLVVTVFGVEHGCPAHRAEPELELGSLVTDANVLSCGAKHLIRCAERGQRCEDTAGPTLTGEAVANADSKRFTLHFNTQLAAGTRGCSRTHCAPREMLFATRLQDYRRTFG